jgi:hypothetical protein
MSPQELTDLSVVIARSQRAGWTSCKPIVLDYFSTLARLERLNEFAEGFSLFVEGIPESAAYLFEILPLVIVTHYPPFIEIELPRLDEAMPAWQDYLSDGLLLPSRFSGHVRRVLCATSC